MKAQIKKYLKIVLSPLLTKLVNYINSRIQNSYNILQDNLNLINNSIQSNYNDFQNSYTSISSRLQSDYNKLQNDYEFKFRRITPQPILTSLEYHLCEHCNLNCYGCDNFSPLAHEQFENINTFERDLDRFSLLSHGKLNTFKLLGGEPLLHPQIEDFMKISRKFFPDTKIIIITNAINLVRMSDSFFATCAEYNIIISPTKYPINIPWGEIENKMNKFSLKLEFYNDAQIEKTSYHMTLDLLGNQDPVQSFLSCYHANQCIFLRHGKLYPCSVVPNIHHFNNFFGKKLEVTDDDYIDIFKANSFKDISSFCAKPIPFCRYCDTQNRTFGIKWRTSKKEIEEWT